MSTPSGEWVQSSLNAHHRRLANRKRNPISTPPPVLSEFHHRAISLLTRAMRRGVYDVAVAWERQDWSHPDMAHLVMYSGGSLATWDFDHLTRLVIGAHDECIRVGIEPVSHRYLRFAFHPRKRDGDAIHSRHPSIETAIESFRK